jgi:hypothetical protein
MCYSFRNYTFHMHYICEACRFIIIPFWLALECPREHAYDETSSSDLVKILVA